VIADQATTAKGRLAREYTVEGLGALIAYEGDYLRALELIASGADPSSNQVLNLIAKKNDDETTSRTFLRRALRELGP
jgi:hypothetical protein